MSAELTDAGARVLALERERDELRQRLEDARLLLEVAQAELRQLRPLRDRVVLGALDTLAAHR